jgi:hypothetical protein
LKQALSDAAGADANSEARAWLAALATDPSIHLHDFDLGQRTATLVRLSEAELRTASFLDARALKPDTKGLVLPIESLIDAAEQVPQRPYDTIFHVAHCGSTLVSRLLAALPNNLPKREPLAWLGAAVHARRVQLDITERAWGRLFNATSRTLARRFRDGERVLLKSTSVGANLMPWALGVDPSQRAICVTMTFESWLAKLLDDESARDDVLGRKLHWLQDLRQTTRRDDVAPDKLGELETLAACWLAPMRWFAGGVRLVPDRTRIVTTEALLEHPTVGLATLAAFLGLGASAEQIQAAVDGPLLKEYSKAPGEAFDRVAAADELKAARERHKDAIAQARAFIDGFQPEPAIAEHLAPR